jgi:hypothetical protein
MSERPLTPQEMSEFRTCAANGGTLLGVSTDAASLDVVQAIEDYVGAWHKPKGGFLARLFASKPDTIQTALALGALWGDQLVREFGWEWTCHRADGMDLYCVVTKDRSLALFPTYYVKACLDDATIDCTIVLAFNMLQAGSVPTLPAGGFENLMSGVQRIVPKGA